MKQIRTTTNMRTGVKYISLEDIIDVLREDIDDDSEDSSIRQENRYIKGLIKRLKDLR